MNPFILSTNSVNISSYPTTMDQLQLSSTETHTSGGEFWLSSDSKLLGKKGKKNLIDLVAEGGEEAQSALNSLFVEVLLCYVML